MKQFLFAAILLFFALGLNAQLVDVRYDYNAMGDCIFTANNNSGVPLFLHMNFADLQNTTFDEPLPYVKRLTPGFNDLFTLLRDPDADGYPRFNYEIKVFRSDPMARIDLEFPYLIPFAPGTKVKVFDVKQIDGFWGKEGLDSWNATGFLTQAGKEVYACRNGTIVEICKAQREGDPQGWYHTWTNSITLLQPDGTLICYKNVTPLSSEIKVGDKIYAGQPFCRIVAGQNELILLIYHDSIFTGNLLFVLPQFETGENRKEILNSVTEYVVSHPAEIRGLEMTGKEKRRLLGK
jgi:hypothetical protein